MTFFSAYRISREPVDLVARTELRWSGAGLPVRNGCKDCQQKKDTMARGRRKLFLTSEVLDKLTLYLEACYVGEDFFVPDTAHDFVVCQGECHNAQKARTIAGYSPVSPVFSRPLT